VLDCIVISAVDMQFDLLHRRGTDNTVIATWTKHFEPLPGSFDAQPYEIDQQGPKVDVQTGDQLVFRFSAMNTTPQDSWIPNGDGRLSQGRIPNITLPK
jgi:hypothetical protein